GGGPGRTRITKAATSINTNRVALEAQTAPVVNPAILRPTACIDIASFLPSTVRTVSVRRALVPPNGVSCQLCRGSFWGRSKERANACDRSDASIQGPSKGLRLLAAVLSRTSDAGMSPRRAKLGRRLLYGGPLLAAPRRAWIPRIATGDEAAWGAAKRRGALI